MKISNTSCRLKQLMRERNLRQVDILALAKPYCEKYDVKLGKNDLSQYVNGKVEPGQEKLTVIGLALNISETWLMGYDVPIERSDFPLSPKTQKSLYNTAEEMFSFNEFYNLSQGAKDLAKDYDSLDNWGRQAIRDLMNTELSRVEEQANFDNILFSQNPKVINLFSEPSAAGIATPVEGTDYEAYELRKDDPQGAAYAVRIQGNSMEPLFPDGSIVFVNHDALRDGDIGIFCVDGGTVCKQYHKQGGVIYLFSLNRNRSDADIVILPGSNRSFICQGRVITKHRAPLPHEL